MIYLTNVMVLNVAHLIIILVHAGIISFKDEFLLEVHITFILNVFRKPLFRAVNKSKGQEACFLTYYTQHVKALQSTNDI